MFTMSKRELDISDIKRRPRTRAQEELAEFMGSDDFRREVETFITDGDLIYCARNRARMTAAACLRRQGIAPLDQSDWAWFGTTVKTPEKCRDCPQGQEIARKEKEKKKMSPRQKTYTEPFVCEKCGEGAGEGKRHRAHGVCQKCYSTLLKEGKVKEWRLERERRLSSELEALGKATRVKLDSPIPETKEIVLDSPIQEKADPDPGEGKPEPGPSETAAPTRITELDDITIQFTRPRDRNLGSLLRLMAVANRRPFLNEIYINLEEAANRFLERNPVFMDTRKRREFIEKEEKE